MISRQRFIQLITLVLFTAVAITGCWDSQEVDQQAFVSALGIDLAKESGEYSVTVQIIRPGQITAPEGGGAGGGSGKEGEAVWVTQSKGKTVFLAVRNLSTLSSRPLSFSHCQNIVFGREAAEQGIRPLMDFLIRSQDFRHTLNVLIAEEKASDILQSVNKLEPISAIGLTGVLAEQRSLSQVRPVNLHSFLGWLISKSSSTMAPRVAVSESGEEKMARLTGMSVFKEDRWVTDLKGKENRGLLWIVGEIDEGFLTIPFPDDVVNLEIIHSSRKLTPKLIQGKLSFLLEIAAEARITVHTSTEELNQQSMEILKRRMAATIKNEVLAALNKARAYNVDIFEFGSALQRAYPREWKELEPRWDEIFPLAEATVKVNAMVVQEGLILKPILPPN